MMHPLQTDLTELKESDIELKIQEITRKYFIVARLNNPQVLTQLSIFLTLYKEELSRRNRDRTQTELGNTDLDQLINVD